MNILGLAMNALAVFFLTLPLVGAAALAVAGILRLAHRRAKHVEVAADALTRAYAAGIFPPSLRGGGPQVPVMRSRPIRRHRRHGGSQ